MGDDFVNRYSEAIKVYAVQNPAEFAALVIGVLTVVAIIYRGIFETFTFILRKLTQLFTLTGDYIKLAFGNEEERNIPLFFIITAVLAAIIFVIIFGLIPLIKGGIETGNWDTSSFGENLRRPLSGEGFQDAASAPKAQPATGPTLDELNRTLQNVQLYAVKQAAYVGPLNGGKFDPDIVIPQTFRNGFRTITLQIDYMEMNKGADFANPGEPTLLFRDDRGTLISSGSGNIEATVKRIAEYAFNQEMPAPSSPVILYLHFIRTPSMITEPEKYLLYLSKVAKALQPIAPFHLGLTAFGTFHRQAMEDELFNIPLKNLKDSIIVLTNVDTTLFRNTKSLGLQEFAPARDLDFYVNARVYKDHEDDEVGAARVAPEGTKPVAVVANLSRLLRLSAEKKETFALKGKDRFVIAMPTQMSNPTVEAFTTALNVLGVNVVPLEPFLFPAAEVDALLSVPERKIYRAKPVALVRAQTAEDRAAATAAAAQAAAEMGTT